MTIYLKGIDKNLKPNDPILFLFQANTAILPAWHPIRDVETQPQLDRTMITLPIPLIASRSVMESRLAVEAPESHGRSELLTMLKRSSAADQPANKLRLVPRYR